MSSTSDALDRLEDALSTGNLTIMLERDLGHEILDAVRELRSECARLRAERDQARAANTGDTTMTRAQASAALAENEAAIAENEKAMHDAWLDAFGLLHDVIPRGPTRGGMVYVSNTERERIAQVIEAGDAAMELDNELQLECGRREVMTWNQ